MHATDTATELAAAIRRREVGSVELLEVFLDRIDRLDGDINAVVTLDAPREITSCWRTSA
jgi:amidase